MPHANAPVGDRPRQRRHQPELAIISRPVTPRIRPRPLKSATPPASWSLPRMETADRFQFFRTVDSVSDTEPTPPSGTEAPASDDGFAPFPPAAPAGRPPGWDPQAISPPPITETTGQHENATSPEDAISSEMSATHGWLRRAGSAIRPAPAFLSVVLFVIVTAALHIAHTPVLVIAIIEAVIVALTVATIACLRLWRSTGRLVHPLAIPAIVLIAVGAISPTVIAVGNHYNENYERSRSSGRLADSLGRLVADGWATAGPGLRDDPIAAQRWLQKVTSQAPGITQSHVRNPNVDGFHVAIIKVHAYELAGALSEHCIAVKIALPSGDITSEPQSSGC